MKNTVNDINKEALSSPDEFIKRAEKEYIDEINALADKIKFDDDLKIVSIAGPSASGKTTTAHILRDRLKKIGVKTAVVSLDDFYLPIDELPILPDGKKDIESVNSLDISLIEKCFNELIKTGKSKMPVFDFANKKRTLEANEVDITNGGIVIAEGLHALNPLLTQLVPRKNIYKIYISVNCPILDENGKQILSSRQIRLIRRSLRDEIFRNTTINDTLSLWSGVVDGEKKYLYCFKETADFQLKTLHLYEPCVYRDRFVAMKNEINRDSCCYDYFCHTVSALEKFQSISKDKVPKSSLIREFIGEGKYN